MFAENTVVGPSARCQTPSGRDGVPPLLELHLRMLACELIQKSGRALKLPQTAIATAQVLLHRFYFVGSFKRFGVQELILGALFLATKLEECPARMCDIVNVAHHQLLKHQGVQSPPALDRHSLDYANYERSMKRAEMYILKYLGFHVDVAHPYVWVINYVKALDASEHPMAQTTWNYVNDSYRLPVHCVYQPHVIATACIALAARRHRVSLPTGASASWHAFFDVPGDVLDHVMREVHHMYTYRLRWDLPVTPEDLAAWLSRYGGSNQTVQLSMDAWKRAKENLVRKRKEEEEERQRLRREAAQAPPLGRPGLAQSSSAKAAGTRKSASAGNVSGKSAVELATLRARALAERVRVGQSSPASAALATVPAQPQKPPQACSRTSVTGRESHGRKNSPRRSASHSRPDRRSYRPCESRSRSRDRHHGSRRDSRSRSRDYDRYHDRSTDSYRPYRQERESQHYDGRKGDGSRRAHEGRDREGDSYRPSRP